MEDMGAQMNAILNDPEMMQKIMSLAQTFSQPAEPGTPETTAQEPFPEALPEMDLATIQKLAGFAGKANIDTNQRSLLKALVPYLSKERIHKLERAMRAAKLANMATAFLNTSGSPFRLGR